MAEDAKDGEEEQPIIIKKINKGHGHHGGAWKVAYADFVTAMMAFFLLLWLLNVTTEEQKNAISNYFDPTHPKVSDSTSGAGGVLGGLSVAPEGAMVTNVQPLTPPQTVTSAIKRSNKKGRDGGAKGGESKKDLEETKKAKVKKKLKKKEEERLGKAEKEIKQAIKDDPELQKLSKNLMVDMTPEGLRIQIVDQEGESMFPSGSAQMFAKTRGLLKKIADIIIKQPNEISVRGHTDSVPFGGGSDYTNWELSTDRAHSSRRVLLDSGYPIDQLNNVVGKADTEHLLPDDPENPQNRRISIILLREELTNPDFNKKVEEEAALEEDEYEYDDEEYEDEYSGEEELQQQPVGTFRKTSGDVQFP